MKTPSFLIISVFLILSCNTDPSEKRYTVDSSQTVLTNYYKLLNNLPEDPIGIAEIASKQMIHHNNLQSFSISENDPKIRTPFPPQLTNILKVLDSIEPYGLSIERSPINRLVGACVSESYFLAGLLRHKGIPARVRVGYFKNINQFPDHVIAFWEEVARYKGFNEQLLKDNPDEWKKIQNAYTQSQIDVDHHIEHWICEYWNKENQKWVLLDANNDFLKLSSNLEVDYELPRIYFEYAHEAWLSMRANPEYNPNKHFEYPLDGRSHIRSQLLNDFYSLLNHDISCYSNIDIPSKEFIKKRTYDELTETELFELDELADLLSQNPSIDTLIQFYNKSQTLQIKSAILDSFSFVSTKKY
jgi:excinuclease ABC subunit A